MKREAFNRIVAGVLIPSVLLPSCTTNSHYFLDEDIDKINASTSFKELSSIAIPINIEKNSSDEKILLFLTQLIQDIVKNPSVAKAFSEDPEGIFKTYGVEGLNIDFDDEYWKLIMSLGDEDLHQSIVTNNVPLFLKLCEEKGLLTELKKSEIIEYQELMINDDTVVINAFPVMAFFAAFLFNSSKEDLKLSRLSCLTCEWYLIILCFNTQR